MAPSALYQPYDISGQTAMVTGDTLVAAEQPCSLTFQHHQLVLTTVRFGVTWLSPQTQECP